jgi:hypothetical protein
MRVRSLFWLFVSVFILTMIAGAPLPGRCDDGTIYQIDPGATPVGDIEGLNQGIAAQRVPWNQDWNAIGMVKTLGEDYSVGARFLHNTITNAIVDLGIKLPEGDSNCPDPQDVSLSLAQIPGSDTQGSMVVAARCGGTISASQAIVDTSQDEPRGSDWIKQAFDEAVNMNSMSAAAVFAGGSTYQTVCGANGSGVYCWAVGGQIVERREFTAPTAESFLVSSVNHAYDDQANIHMVGVTTGGELTYAKFPKGSNQADPDSVKNLGQASQNQSWKWNQVRVAPNGTVYISSYNALEGILYVFYKASDSADHWYFRAFSSSDGPMGMRNSMAVDNQTNNAVCTFADSAGHLCVLIVKPDGSSKLTTFGSLSEIFGTATTAGDGKGDSYSLDGTKLPFIPCLPGARLEF